MSVTMGPLTLPLLVLLWRTSAVSGASCHSTIKYFSSPRPVYKIENNLDVIIYTCNISHNSTIKNLPRTKDDPYPIVDVAKMCLKNKKEKFNCPEVSPTTTTRTASVQCTSDNTNQPVVVTVSISLATVDTEVNRINVHGHICQYSSGECVSKDGNNTFFIWQPHVVKPRLNPCDSFSIYRTGYQWVGEFQNSSSRYIVVTELYNEANMYSLELLRPTKSYCGTVWRTSSNGLMVSDRDLRSNDTKYSLKRYEKFVLDKWKLACNSTKDVFSAEGATEVPFFQDNMCLLYSFILLYIVGTLFNIVVNYCTLRQFHQKRGLSGRMYIFYSLMQSLSNRYIYLSLENSNESDISNASSTTHNNIRSNSGNGYDVEGYLKPTENHARAAKSPYDKDCYFKYLDSNNAMPTNEVYSYAYMK